MDRPVAGPGPATGGLTLAAVLFAGLPLFRRTYRLPRYQWKILSAIQQCRTPALGGHRYQCGQCGREHFVPHGCGTQPEFFHACRPLHAGYTA